MRKIELVGQVFDRWTVVSRAENTPQGQAMWTCRCECGVEKTLKSIVLRRGLSKSCGCWKLEMLVERSTKHGHGPASGYSPTYSTWAAMVKRCTNPNAPTYYRYGGRGIEVCERWRDFVNFLADMGEKPDGMTLDRVDNEGHYGPDNCRWATMKVQGRNRSNNHVITFRGETRCLSEWAETVGINLATLKDRLENGWAIEEAFSTPVERRTWGRPSSSK